MMHLFKFFLSFVLICAGWLAVAGIAGAIGRFDTLIVPVSTADFPKQLSKNVSIVGQSGPFLIFRGDPEKLAPDLRAAGARLILPARAKTCLDLQGMTGRQVRLK